MNSKLHTRVAAGLLATGVVLTLYMEAHQPQPKAPASASTEAPAQTEAPSSYRGSAEAPIQEDDPRWDCRTMGNRICGPNHAPLINLTDIYYSLAERPGCFIEPSGTLEGYEVIYYHKLTDRYLLANEFAYDYGFEVPCPRGFLHFG